MGYWEDTTIQQYFGCKVTGGYPRPEVQVHVLEGGNAEVVPLSILDLTTLVGNDLGLQVSSR